MRFGEPKAGVPLQRAWEIARMLDDDVNAADGVAKALTLSAPTRARAEYDTSMAARKAWETRKARSG